MPPINKQSLQIVPLGVDQRTDASQLPSGKMLEMVNVQQKVPGVYSKRYGYAKKTTATATGGTVPNGRDLSSTGDALVLRSNEGLYFDSQALGKWVRKADIATVATPPSPFVMPFGYRPSIAQTVDGKLRYHFVGDAGENSVAQTSLFQVGNGVTLPNTNRPSYWYYRIVDAASGTEIVAPTSIPTVIGWQAKAVAAGGFIWLFVGAGAGGGFVRYIYAAKFDPTNPTVAPVITTYYDAGGAATIEGWDVALNNLGQVNVVAMGAALAKQGGGTANGVASILDTTTGLPTGIGSVGIAVPLPAAECCVSILPDENTAPASVYFVACGAGGMTINVYTLNAAAMTLTTTTALGVGAANNLVTGFAKAAGGWTTYYCQGGGGVPAGDSLFAISTDAAGVSTGAFVGIDYGSARSICTQAFRLAGGTKWYLIVQHDDNLAHTQPGYYLVDAASMKILGRALYGSAGDYDQRASYIAGTTNWSSITSVVTDATIVYACLNSWNGAQYVTREVQFAIDDSTVGAARKLGPMCRAADGQEIAVPGGWPHHASGSTVGEYVPMYPEAAPVMVMVAAATSSCLLGAYTGYYLYARTDALGNVHRSAPSPAGTVTVSLNPDVDAIAFTASAAGNDLGTIVAATTGALPACTAFGTGIGKTLTENANGAIVIDGVSPTAGQQVLIKNQAAAVDNGLYVVTQAGTAGTPFILTRATNFDRPSVLSRQVVAAISGGSSNHDTYWTPTSVKNIQWTAGGLRITNSAKGDWNVEFYLTQPGSVSPNVGTPYLQFYIPNDPLFGSGLQFVQDQPAVSTAAQLYSFSNAELPNQSPAPFAIAAAWRSRLFLSDTDTIGDVWVSKEKVPGIGFGFSAVLTFNIAEGNGRIRAMGQVDFNAFALFKSDGIWVITGDGPDGAFGRNMYRPVRLPVPFGCTNQRSLVLIPNVGLAFQASAPDGGVYVLTRDLQVTYLGNGVEGFRSSLINGGAFVSSNGQLRLIVGN